MSDQSSPTSTRIGSQYNPRTKAAGHGIRPRARRPWGLRLLPAPLFVPLTTSLIGGAPLKLIGLMAGVVALILAGIAVRRGLVGEAEFEARRVANRPAPYKLLGALLTGGGLATISLFATNYGLPMSIVFGALGMLGVILAYGMDPLRGKGLAADVAQRTGVRSEQVIKAVTEAEAKIRAIEGNAERLQAREFRAQVGRISMLARDVLAEIEDDPKDLARARRFLVTYLDGTKDVVSMFVNRQSDFQDTELVLRFRTVLGTIERVFGEQVDHLKKNEALDFEVSLDVLKTQLEREGAG
ncbi:MAG: 5-bromo-4-chloroindolyl phosphate hydrolysis family protein [Geminicoccaceae bacterium]